jgi:glutathione S-transferase
MAEMIFYTHPRSRGRMIRWMLEETGVDYETVLLEYGESMQTAEFRAINPMRKVPVIVHRGAVVTECAAICAYLADAFPDAGLAPATDQRADYYRWLFFAAGPLEAAIINRALGVQPTPEQQGFVGYGDMDRVLEALERAVTGHAWVAGEHFSAADVYLGSQLGFGLQFGTIDKRPAFEDYVRRTTDRDAYRRAAALDDALLQSKV